MVAAVSADGHLALFYPSTGRSLLLPPIDAARWIALMQCWGDVQATATSLARMWQLDPVNVAADLELWVNELLEHGFLSIEPVEDQ
jgi:hypothetical protein